MTPVRSRRLASGTASFVALVGLLGVVSASGACVRTGAGLGQSCLKDDDCFSGHCAAQLCVPAAPELSPDAAEGDAPAPTDGPSADDGPSEGSEGSIDGGSGDALATDADASVPDGATDGSSAPDGTDGPGSADAEASSDASLDAPADGAADANLDSGAG